ncbi:hypothetical protein KR222_001820, partial [Zaprionus bogoriensis]
QVVDRFSTEMRLLTLSVLSLLSVTYAAEANSKIVCYYDSAGYLRKSLSKVDFKDLEMSLHFCTHLVYGYAGINPNTFEVYSLNVDLDMFHYQEITHLRTKFPHLRVLLSVGGDHDALGEDSNHYLRLLEANRTVQQNFIDSSMILLRRNGFDGLDLAFQLPKNKPRKVHGTVGSYWKRFKKLFTGDFIVDPQAEQHKDQFTRLVGNLKSVFQSASLLLSLTVLPNVNSTWYFDIPAFNGLIDFVNLAAFDFLTPARNPEEADYTAPLYSDATQNRLPHYNADFQVQYWLKHGYPASKLNLGVASYGNAWKLSEDSGLEGIPVVPHTKGAAPEGLQSQKPGLLSYPEICSKLSNPQNQYLKGNDSPLRRVTDTSKRFGNFAFRAVQGDVTEGIWISFDDADAASNKASYVRANNLGGIALFDLGYDDFRGLCNGEKYPILRAIKYKL